MLSIIKNVLLVLLAVVVVVYIIHLAVRSVKKANTMFTRNKAVLLSKKEVTGADNATVYSLTFEMQDDKKTKAEYICCKRMYESVREGDEDMLIRSGNRLIQFGQNVNVEE